MSLRSPAFQESTRKRSADLFPGLLRDSGALDLGGGASEGDVLAYLRDRRFRGYEAAAAISWLGMYGTLDAVPVLKEATSSSDTEVRAEAAEAVGEIARAREAPFYLDCLTRSDFRPKSVAMRLLLRYGDASAVEAVIERAKRVLRNGLRNEGSMRMEVAWAALFVRRYEYENEVAERFYEHVYERWGRLKSYEQVELEWLASHVWEKRKRVPGAG